MTTPIFPLKPLTNPAFSVHRRPTFNSILDEGKKNLRGIETYQQQTPLWEFELRYEILRDKTQNIIPDATGLGNYVELQELLQLYLACGATYGEFFFDDWTDHSREQQLIGIGDDATTDFILIRTIQGSGISFTEAVGGVNLNHSVVVYLDGVAVDPLDWEISSDLTTLEFAAAPAFGALVTITFYYYYRCRFVSEQEEFEEFFANRWLVNSLRFRSISPGLVNPLEPVPAPIPVNLPYICLSDFQWHTSSVFSTSDPTNGVQAVDNLGNYYHLAISGFTGLLEVYSPLGSLLQSYSQEDLADMIDSWYGSAIVLRGHFAATAGFIAKPVLNGQYVLACSGQQDSPLVNSHAVWWALLQPAIDGSLTCVGAVYYIGPINCPPYTGGVNILGAANAKTSSDPLVAHAYFALGAWDACLVVLPSVDDFLAGTYTSGILFGFGACRVPPTIINYWGGLAYRFLVNVTNSLCSRSGILLPNSSGGSSLYFYLNRFYMDLTASGAGFFCPEVKNTIQPSNPDGCMVKMDLGVLDFFTLASTPLSGLYSGQRQLSYTIDNSNWRYTSGLTTLPWSDEYTYLSSGIFGGDDSYTMLPGGIISRPGGKWWVLFFMAGVKDALNNSNALLYDAIRIFEYDPSTNVATQLTRIVCVVHTKDEVGTTPTATQNRDYFQTMTIEESGSDITVVVHGMTYLDNFAQFTLP